MLYQGENPKVQDTARMDPDRHKKAAKKEPMVSAPIMAPTHCHLPADPQVKHINPQSTAIIFDVISHLQKQELRLTDSQDMK